MSNLGLVDWNLGPDFQIRALRGKIAQSVVETVFLRFGWLVYPFGYESYFTNIIWSLSQGYQPVIRQIRAMPDLFVFKPDEERGDLVEVKGTHMRLEDWRIRADQLTQYLTHWKHAMLAVLTLQTFEIAVLPIEALDGVTLPTAPEDSELRIINLRARGQTLPSRFGWDVAQYNAVVGEILTETRRFFGGRWPT
jgi:hypothetical protein